MQGYLRLKLRDRKKKEHRGWWSKHWQESGVLLNDLDDGAELLDLDDAIKVVKSAETLNIVLEFSFETFKSI